MNLCHRHKFGVQSGLDPNESQNNHEAGHIGVSIKLAIAIERVAIGIIIAYGKKHSIGGIRAPNGFGTILTSRIEVARELTRHGANYFFY